MRVLLFLFTSVFLISYSFAFPEMIRHGYTSCTACHVSPTGGGILTPYGRELSKEILSTWGKENEGQFLNGKVNLPDWLLMGGDVRYMQLYRKNSSVEEARTLPMQTDLETAIIIKKFIVSISGGIQHAESSEPEKGSFLSRRHYIGYKASDNISIRAGRFFPAYGINIPEHASVIKRGLKWDQGGETYNLEINYLKNNLEIFVSGLFGRPDVSNNNSDKGYSISPSYSLSDKIKIGINYLDGNSEQFNRKLYGMHILAAYNEKLYFLSEIDWQKIKLASVSQNSNGFFNYNKLGYEIVQGLHFNFTFEYGQSDLNRSTSIIRTVGPGFQFFPRPHIEISGLWSKQQIVAVSDKYGDFAYIILHYYF